LINHCLLLPEAGLNHIKLSPKNLIDGHIEVLTIDHLIFLAGMGQAGGERRN